jgi:hypothetical protein
MRSTSSAGERNDVADLPSFQSASSARGVEQRRRPVHPIGWRLITASGIAICAKATPAWPSYFGSRRATLDQIAVLRATPGAVVGAGSNIEPTPRLPALACPVEFNCCAVQQLKTRR